MGVWWVCLLFGRVYVVCVGVWLVVLVWMLCVCVWCVCVVCVVRVCVGWVCGVWGGCGWVVWVGCV